MSNPGDRWRRGWLLPIAALVAVLALVLGRCASDNSGSSSDTQAAVAESTTSAATLSPFGIDVGTNGILLSGTVPTEEEHQALVAAAKATWPGVSVVDQIQVADGAPTVGDAAALFAGLRGVSPVFSLKTDDAGALRLDGAVATADQRDAIGAAVAAATGRTVDNRLTVAEAPATEAPATEAPATEAPATEAPATEAPATEAPATEAPATEAPTTEAPTTAAPEATTTTVAPEAAATAQAIADEIKLNGIEFLSGSATLTNAAKATLDQVAKTLADHPEVKVQIGGHTDSSGNAAANKKLSQQRADAVLAYLVSKGIDKARLTAVGFGAEKPIADNATAEGRTKNRRIEFTPACEGGAGALLLRCRRPRRRGADHSRPENHMSARSSYASGPSTQPLLGETIGANLERIVERFADREALVSAHQGLRYTYAQFNEQVDLIARGLLARGVQTGDRVGIWSPNYAEWTIVQYATAKVGAILVNINPAYRLHELAFALNQSGCRLLFAAPQFKTSDYRSMVEQVRPELTALERTVFFFSPDWDDLRTEGEGVSMDQLRTRADGLQFDDPINIQYTSGTTGFPKGATLSHHNILNNGYFVGEGCKYTEQDRICIPVPLYHCFGMVMGNLGATTHGACMVYPEAAFDAAATLRTVSAERCTSLYGVPTMFIANLQHADFATTDFSSLRTGIMAGSPCPVEVMKQVTAQMHMPEVGICYGMTETSPVSTQTATDDSLDRRTGTVGQVMPHVEVKIVDPESGRVVDRTQPGELCTRGYSVMLGYWNEPEKTADSIDRAGWMHTGDLAVMDDEGYVNIVGRIKDMIIRGGENVYPREIEEFLYTHPQVADVQVIGVPDVKYGEEIMAWVKLAEGTDPATVSTDDIREYCRGKIAHYKVPRYVRFATEFPMTVTGKVRKIEMREVSIEELGLHDAANVKNA